MMMPEDVYATFVACAEKFRDLHNGDDDQRREAMSLTVQTIRARHGVRWVHKTEHSNLAAGSKDAIGYVPDGEVSHGQRTTMHIWDMINGTTRAPVGRGESQEFREAYVLAPAAVDQLGPRPPVDTHRYEGGAHDTGTCERDTCGRGRHDPVHAVPEGKVPHRPWLGQDRKGPFCDLCHKDADTDPIHHQIDALITGDLRETNDLLRQILAVLKEQR